jgi:hypothetical protein
MYIEETDVIFPPYHSNVALLLSYISGNRIGIMSPEKQQFLSQI